LINTCINFYLILFADEVSFFGEPFRRAELDAYYARLYGLTRDELRYTLRVDPKEVHGEDFPGETVRVVREMDVRLYGEYRTRRLVLEAWELFKYEDGIIVCGNDFPREIFCVPKRKKVMLIYSITRIIMTRTWQIRQLLKDFYRRKCVHLFLNYLTQTEFESQWTGR
jgi:hypothetical protein